MTFPQELFHEAKAQPRARLLKLLHFRLSSSLWFIIRELGAVPLHENYFFNEINENILGWKQCVD